MNSTPKGRAGYVAIVGRPNVGKSTLLNHILGQKISITSRKPQTTRHRIMGISTKGNSQALFVDTPGIHKNAPKAINRYMNRAAIGSMNEVDIVIFVVDALKWTSDDEHVLSTLNDVSCPVVLVINKVDRISDQNRLLMHIQLLSQRFKFTDVFPISATKRLNITQLEERIMMLLPLGEPFYDEAQITDRSERFIVAELIREKIVRQLGDELPYEMTVEVDEFLCEEGLITVSATILVERPSQKAIVIGKQGKRIKKIGTEARVDMEALLESKVMLNLWVKVKSGWSDDDRALRSLGYQD